ASRRRPPVHADAQGGGGRLSDGDDVLARRLPGRRRPSARVPDARASVSPLELLYEPAGLPALALPQELAELYPGSLALPGDCLYVNFVETLDGVVALPDVARSN